MEDKKYSKEEVKQILNEELAGERKRHKKFLAVICIALAVIFFLAGLFTYYMIIGKDMLALKWAIDKVEDESILELSREEIIKAAGTGATTSLIDQYSGFLTPKDLNAFYDEFNGSNENFGLSIMEGDLRKNIPNYGVFVADVLAGSQAESKNVPIMSLIKEVEVNGKVYKTLSYGIKEMDKFFKIGIGESIKITFAENDFLYDSENAIERTIEFTRTQVDSDYFGLSLIEGEVVNSMDISGSFVVQTAGGSPAEKANIKPLSKFYKIKVNGEEHFVEDKTTDEIFDIIGENRTAEFCFKEITFDNGRLVETIRPYVSITKAEYNQKYLIYLDSEHPYGIDNTKALRENPITLDKDTAYIQFDNFFGGLPEEFAIAMNYFKNGGKSKLILDLRGNGGGDLQVLCKIAGYLTSSATSDEKQLVLTMKNKKNGKEEKCYTNGNRYREGYKVENLVVLCDGGTASASEALMGAIMDYRGHSYSTPNNKLLIVGDNTYGKDIVQTTYTMPLTGYGVKITTAQYFTPSGNELNAENTNVNEYGEIKGIMPNYFITNNAYNLPYAYEKDNELNFAINYLKGL